MASWKCGVYVVVGTILIALIILLNFDLLPKRRLSEELELTTKSSFKGSTASKGIPNTLKALPTERTTSNLHSAVTKNNERKISIEQYKKEISNWSCTEKSLSPMDNLPELSFNDVKDFKWNCTVFSQTPEVFDENVTKSLCYNYDDPFICLRDPVHCQWKDESDKRFLTRPQYGEYEYLPKSLWLSVVMHGGVAFLYHPCVSNDTVDILREMAVSCLHRHVITPYERLNPCKPVAMVTWSCFYSTSQVNMSEGKHWIRKNAMKAPASYVSENGQYNKGLLKAAKTVSDKHDIDLCPDKIRSMLNSGERESHFSRKQDTSQRDWMQGHGESISIQNTEEVVIVNERVSSNHKFDTSNAAWALGSVIFLCVVLGGVLLYTRLWQNRDHWWRVEAYNSNTKFNFMKTRGHTWKSRTFPTKKTSGYTRLLNSIPEEIEDDI